MSAQDRVGKLQGLLERIQRNAGKPRVKSSSGVVPSAGAPMATAAPAPAPSDGVDELLAAPAPALTPSPPLAVEVDVQLESVPPAEERAIPMAAATQPEPPVEDTLGLDSEVSEVREVTMATREPAVEVTVAAIEAEAEPMAPEELSEDDLVEV